MGCGETLRDHKHTCTYMVAHFKRSEWSSTSKSFSPVSSVLEVKSFELSSSPWSSREILADLAPLSPSSNMEEAEEDGETKGEW